jgi:hypothetical protein
MLQILTLDIDKPSDLPESTVHQARWDPAISKPFQNHVVQK